MKKTNLFVALGMAALLLVAVALADMGSGQIHLQKQTEYLPLINTAADEEKQEYAHVGDTVPLGYGFPMFSDILFRLDWVEVDSTLDTLLDNSTADSSWIVAYLLNSYDGVTWVEVLPARDCVVAPDRDQSAAFHCWIHPKPETPLDTLLGIWWALGVSGKLWSAIDSAHVCSVKVDATIQGWDAP